MLGVTPAAVSKRIKSGKRLQEFVKAIKAFHLDVAESKLLSAVGKEKGWAVMYYLNNQGKPRGYGRKWWDDESAGEENVETVEWTDPGPPKSPDQDDLAACVDARKLLEDIPSRSHLTDEDLGLNGRGARGSGQRVNGERNGED